MEELIISQTQELMKIPIKKLKFYGKQLHITNYHKYNKKSKHCLVKLIINLINNHTAEHILLHTKPQKVLLILIKRRGYKLRSVIQRKKKPIMIEWLIMNNYFSSEWVLKDDREKIKQIQIELKSIRYLNLPQEFNTIAQL